MSPIRFLSPVGILVLGGLPGRPVFWLHEPILVAWHAAFPRPVAGETPCECGHAPAEHPLGRQCAVRRPDRTARSCECLFFRAQRADRRTVTR